MAFFTHLLSSSHYTTFFNCFIRNNTKNLKAPTVVLLKYGNAFLLRKIPYI